MRQMEKNTNKNNKTKNNSSNSLVFGQWPQTKMMPLQMSNLVTGDLRQKGFVPLNNPFLKAKITTLYSFGITRATR